MSLIKYYFYQFRSIFVSGDVLKENEEHANIVTATSMFNMFLVCVLTCILTHAEVFSIENEVADSLLKRSVVLFLIPALVCFIYKGKTRWLKYLLFSCCVLMLGVSDVLMKFNITLVMVVPLVLAARYYNRKFTTVVAALITITFTAAAYLGVKVSQQDLNSYNLVIPEGTTITVDSTLQDAISEIPVDEDQRAKDVMVHLFIPKYLVYIVIAFACIQVSQSGKNMIDKQKELSEEGARIESELSLATNIQAAMLPHIFPAFPERPEFDIFASMDPAKEVGGDFYDYFLVDDDHLCMIIADVSGKGVPAALFMMASKIILQSVAMMGYSPAEVLTRANEAVCKGNEAQMFVTVWLGILELSTGKLTAANAGHEYPAIKQADGAFELYKDKHGFVMGGMEGVRYKEYEVQLKPGSKIFVYTDGVPEATNAEKKLYGTEFMVDALNADPNANPQELLDNVRSSVDSFVKDAEQFDDLTMLCLEYIGKGQNT